MEEEIPLRCLAKHFGKRSGDVRVDILQRLYKDPWHWLRRQLHWEVKNMNRLTSMDIKKTSIDSLSFDILSCTYWCTVACAFLCLWHVVTFVWCPSDEAAMVRLFWCRTNSLLRNSQNVFRLCWGSDRTKRASSMLWRSLTWAEWTPSRERTEHLGNAAQRCFL